MPDGTTDAAPQTSTMLSAGEGAAPASTPDPRGWLPEEFRADPTFKDLPDLPALAKSYKHAASMVGADRAQLLRLPKDDAPDAWNEVWDRLGRPKAPEEYGLDSQAVPKEVLGEFSKAAHAAGLTKAQAAKVLEFYQGAIEQTGTQTAEAEQAKVGEVVAGLRREWGAAYAPRVKAIETLVQQVAGPEAFGEVDALVKAGNTRILNILATAAERMLEPTGLRSGGRGGDGPLTPEAAQREIRALQGDRDFSAKIMNRDHPGYAEAKQRWDELHRYAFPA